MEKEGLIEIDSPFAKKIGFTSDKFYIDMSYIQKIKNNICIITIQSKIKRKGYFKELCNRILKSGYNIKIIDPIMDMSKIIIKENYELTYEKSKNFFFPYSQFLTGEEVVEVWIKKAG